MANPSAVTDTPAEQAITIEAATIEEALAKVSADLGPNARILSADRVRRGGIGGFFAKEVVEVRAEPVGAPGKGVVAAFDQLLAAAEANDHPAAGGEGPGEPDAARPPATTPDRRGVSSTSPVVTVDWSPARMTEVGLPHQLAQAVDGLDPADDLGHLQALTAALAPVCGPLPSGPARLVGSRADRLRAAVEPSESDGGHIHLVVGDELPDSLPGVPSVVSWVSDRGAARAIALALGTGARLGYGMASGFGSPARRISPVDAALAVRELMERR